METMETNVKKYITSLLTSTPLVVTIQQLNKDYRNTIGEPVPYQKLGYNSLEHLLRSIPDTVQVKGGGPTAQVIPVIQEKSAHVNQLVSKQKIVRNNKRNVITTQKRMNVIFPAGYNHYPKKIENVAPQMPPKKMHYPVKKDTYSSQPVSTSSGIYQSGSLNNSEFSTVQKNNISYVPQNNSEVLKKQSNVFESTKDSNKLEEKRFSEDKRLLEDKRFSEEKPLPCATPSTSSVARWVNNSRRIVKDLDRITSEQLENSIPMHIRNNLRSLIRQCPEGIWCTKVPEKYRNMFRQELDYQELGFKSLIDLCTRLSSIFHYVMPSSGDCKLYDRSRPLPDCAEKSYTIASYGSNNKTNSDTDYNALPNVDFTDLQKFLPTDIFMPGKEIPRTFISHDVQEGDEVDVVVGEIYDLSKFWVYMTDSKLDVLMDSIQEFYTEYAQDYLIPDYLIKEGTYCVQVIFGEYHRALIVDTMPELEDTIRVIFIDYGTMTKVSTKGLCFLHVKFSTFEAQAIRCRLANVFPLEEGAPWSREACKAFRKLVVDKDLTAKIIHINWDEQVLEVYMADVTEPNKSFYINDKLVEEGFALQPNKEKKQPIVDSIHIPIVKYLHLFPTFLELEHGFVPSTAEMEIFQECNVPINFLYPQYFYIDQSSEEAIIKAAEEFHEKYCIRDKRRTPSSQYFDRERYKVQELDLSIFGDLQHEIKAFLDKPLEKKQNDIVNSEDFVDADEELVQEQKSQATDLNLLMEQLKELNTREEETVSVLKKDLMVTEDIMKDISHICKFEYPSDVPSKDQNVQLLESCDLDSLKEEWQGANTISTVNESVEGLNSIVVKKEPLSDSDDAESHGDLSSHPLSAIKFEESRVSDDENVDQFSDHSYDLHLPDVRLDSIKISLLPEDHPLSIIKRLKAETELKIQNLLDDELFADVETNGQEWAEVDDVETKNKSIPQESADACTNPFLKDLNGTSDLEIDVTKLNPNNPFLNFLQDDDKCSTGSSTSTVYESPTMVTQHSWTSFSDMSADTISQLGKSLRSSSSSSSSMRFSDDHRSCSTQTSEQHNKAVQVVETRSQYSYICPPAYGYTPYPPADYRSNPYYSVRMSNVQGYMLESQAGMRPACLPPGLPPPPGFFPQNRFHPPGSFGLPSSSCGSMPYGSQGPMCYYPTGVMPGSVMPRFPPAFNNPNLQSTKVLADAACSSTSMPSGGVSAAKESRDFYEMYNEQLMRKINHSSQ